MRADDAPRDARRSSVRTPPKTFPLHFGSDDEAKRTIHESEGKQAQELISVDQPKLVEGHRLLLGVEDAESVFAGVVVAGFLETNNLHLAHVFGLGIQKKTSHRSGDGCERFFVQGYWGLRHVFAEHLVVPCARVREDETFEKRIGARTVIFFLGSDDVLYEMLKARRRIRVIEFCERGCRTRICKRLGGCILGSKSSGMGKSSGKEEKECHSGAPLRERIARVSKIFKLTLARNCARSVTTAETWCCSAKMGLARAERWPRREGPRTEMWARSEWGRHKAQGFAANGTVFGAEKVGAKPMTSLFTSRIDTLNGGARHQRHNALPQ